MQYILLIFVTLTVSLWKQLQIQLPVFKKKNPVAISKDPKILKVLDKKLGFKIKSFKILKSKKPFAMMIGLPGYPQLIISEKLYKTFEKSELEYVLMHEAGHYIRNHTIREAVYTFLFILGGIFVLSTIDNLWVAILVSIGLGVINGLILIQLGKWHEYEAEYFARENIKNKIGMINATEKFRKYYGNYGVRNSFLQWAFYRALPFDERIKIAQSKKL